MAYSDTNKVKFGIKNLYFAPMAADGTYAAPFANPGAVSASLEKTGDTSDFYADNIKYYSEEPNQGYEGDVEVAKLVDDYYTEILGQTESGSQLIESSDDVFSKFAMGFETKGDKVSVRFCFYECSAGRPTIEASTTEDTNEPQTETITVTVVPATMGEHINVVRVKEVIDYKSTEVKDFETWFKTCLGVTA